MQPTSPDPVEMVRQYEADENLARILQEYHVFDYVEQDYYQDESTRVAQQLQAEFDSENLEVISAQSSIGSPGQLESLDVTTSADDTFDAESGDDAFRESESRYLESRGIGQENEGDIEEDVAGIEVEDEMENEDEDGEDGDDEDEDDEDEDEEDETDEDDAGESGEEEIEEDGEESFEDDAEFDVLNRSKFSPSEIDRLPTRIHSAVPPSSSESETKTCQICQESYVSGDELRILPCFHEFHPFCIDPWLLKSITCPVCRVKVDLTERVTC